MASITQKQKVLMLVIDEMNKINIKSKLFIEKVLFLLKKEEDLDKIIKFYSFFPYKYGPFSSVSYDDLNKLIKSGFVTDNLEVTKRGKIESRKIFGTVNPKILNIIKKIDSKDKIKRYVYEKYPEYTIKSQIKPVKIPKLKPGIFTIGYEGRNIDDFLDALIKNQIDMIIDIRHNPFSMNFAFIQNKLKRKLQIVGIEYIHIKSLGIEGTLRKSLYSTEDYIKLFDIYRKRIRKENEEEIKQIISMGQKNRIALLCFENNKEMCHRGIVAEEIENHGMKVLHL